MMPVLFDLKLFGMEIAIPGYGFLLAIAFLIALWVALRQARASGLEPSLITDVWIVSLVSGWLGAKLLLYLVDLDYYLANPKAILTTLRSAGVFYGGLLMAIGASLVLLKRRRVDAWVAGDVVAPAIIMGQAIGRLGCLAAGCCYGKACSLPWAVTFTNPRAHEFTGVPLNEPLHPVQLYMAAADLAMFFVLLAVAKRKRFDGQVLLLYLILYALVRGTLEIFRGDPRGEVAGLSTSQAISIAVGAVALILYVRRRKRAPGSGLSKGSRARGKAVATR